MGFFTFFNYKKNVILNTKNDNILVNPVNNIKSDIPIAENDDTLVNPINNIKLDTPISKKTPDIVNNIMDDFSSVKDNVYNNILSIKKILLSQKYNPFDGINMDSHSYIYIGVLIGILLFILYIISIISAKITVERFIKRNLNKKWMVFLISKYKYLLYLIVFLHFSFILSYIYLISYRLFNLLYMLIEFLAKFNLNLDNSYRLTIEFIVFLLLFSISLILMNIFNKKSEKGYYSKFLIFIALFLSCILLYWLGVLYNYWSINMHPIFLTILGGWTIITNISICYTYISNLGISWNSIICKISEFIDHSDFFKVLKSLSKLSVIKNLFNQLTFKNIGKWSIFFFHMDQLDGTRQLFAVANEADHNSIRKSTFLSIQHSICNVQNATVTEDNKPLSWYHGLSFKNGEWYRFPMPRAHPLIPSHYRVTNPFIISSIMEYYNNCLHNDADHIDKHVIYLNELVYKYNREDYEMSKSLLLDTVFHIIPSDNEKRLILSMNAENIGNNLYNSIRHFKINPQNGDFIRQVCIFNPNFSILHRIRNIDFGLYSLDSDSGCPYEGYCALRVDTRSIRLNTTSANFRNYLLSDFNHQMMFRNRDAGRINYIDSLRRKNNSTPAEIVADAYNLCTFSVDKQLGYFQTDLESYMNRNTELTKDQVREAMDEIKPVVDVYGKVSKERIEMTIRGMKKKPVTSFENLKWRYIFARGSGDMNTSIVVEKVIANNPDFKSTFSKIPQEII